MKDREKELKYLIYLRSQLIKEAKKDIKNFHREIDEINKQKTKERKSRNGKL